MCRQEKYIHTYIYIVQTPRRQQRKLQKLSFFRATFLLGWLSWFCLRPLFTGLLWNCLQIYNLSAVSLPIRESHSGPGVPRALIGLFSRKNQRGCASRIRQVAPTGYVVRCNLSDGLHTSVDCNATRYIAPGQVQVQVQDQDQVYCPLPIRVPALDTVSCAISRALVPIFQGAAVAWFCFSIIQS